MIQQIIATYVLVFWILCPLLAVRFYRNAGFATAYLQGARIAHEFIWTFLVIALAIVVSYYEVTRHVFF